MAILDIRGDTLSAADPPIATNPNPDLAIKAPVRVATTGSNINLQTIGLGTIDGVALAAGDRVLVKDQTDATTNGLYNATTGPWTRTIDGNNNSQWTTGTQVAVAAGAINAGNSYKLTTAIPVIITTSLLTFALMTAAIAGGANPTAKVGLTTVNGAALTFMRSDAAPAIDQSVAPTWTGLHTFAAGIAIAPPSGATQGIAVTQTGSGAGTAPYSFNAINITDNLASTGTVDGFSIFQGLNGSAVNSARQAFQSTLWLVNPTSASNANRNYVAGVFVSNAVSNDGGGGGSEKGSIFAVNPVAMLSASATHMAQCIGGEVDISCASGSSVLDKYGWSIVQLSTDAVAGSRNDAAQLYVNQGGAVGWGTLIQVGNGLNASPLTASGSILVIKGSPTIANGIDLSGAGTISGSAFKSPGFSVTGAGLLATGANGGTGGSLTLNGATSGSAVLSVTATGGTLNLASAMAIAPTIAANTSADGLILNDTTVASAGNQQFSPRLRLTGQGWKTTATAASQAVDWIIENQPVQGAANPTSNLVISSQINAGGYTALCLLSSAAVLTLGAVGAGGQITLNGGTSGSATIAASATAGTLNFNGTNASINSSGNLTATGIVNLSFVDTPAATTLTGASGSAGFATPSLIINASGTFTLTLPAASGLPGAWFYIRSIAAQIINSASSNIVALAGGAAAAAILTAGAGKWASLQSDGTNYQIMAGVT